MSENIRLTDKGRQRLRDSDIDSLSADGAQDTERMQDPRAALADCQYPVDGRTCKRRSRYWCDAPDMPRQRYCTQHVLVVQTWDTTGRVYVYD